MKHPFLHQIVALFLIIALANPQASAGVERGSTGDKRIHLGLSLQTEALAPSPVASVETTGLEGLTIARALRRNAQAARRTHPIPAALRTHYSASMTPSNLDQIVRLLDEAIPGHAWKLVGFWNDIILGAPQTPSTTAQSLLRLTTTAVYLLELMVILPSELILGSLGQDLAHHIRKMRTMIIDHDSRFANSVGQLGESILGDFQRLLNQTTTAQAHLINKELAALRASGYRFRTLSAFLSTSVRMACTSDTLAQYALGDAIPTWRVPFLRAGLALYKEQFILPKETDEVDLLRHVIDQGLSRKALSRMISFTPRQIGLMISGKRHLTPDLKFRLRIALTWAGFLYAEHPVPLKGVVLNESVHARPRPIDQLPSLWSALILWTEVQPESDIEVWDALTTSMALMEKMRGEDGPVARVILKHIDPIQKQIIRYGRDRLSLDLHVLIDQGHLWSSIEHYLKNAGINITANALRHYMKKEREPVTSFIGPLRAALRDFKNQFLFEAEADPLQVLERVLALKFPLVTLAKHARMSTTYLRKLAHYHHIANALQVGDIRNALVELQFIPTTPRSLLENASS